MAATETRYEHIVLNEARVAMVAGTTMKVVELVVEQQAYGWSPEELHMDHHVPRAITVGLRLRGVEVLTAAEDGASEADDPALLDRAMTVGRAIFTHDEDRWWR
jgi:hypothetical protein